MALFVVLLLGFFGVAVLARWCQVLAFGASPPFRTEDDPAWLTYWTEQT